MTGYTLSLELSSLRLVEFANKGCDYLIQREEVTFFSQHAVNKEIFIQEVKDALLKIRASWQLEKIQTHCVLSSDFSFLRIVKLERNSSFIPTSTVIRRDIKNLTPLPSKELNIGYLNLNSLETGKPKKLAYAAIKTEFLETLTEAMLEAGFLIQKISLLPLSLSTLSFSKKILLINLSDHSVNFLIVSPKKYILGKDSLYFYDWNHHFCERKSEIPLFLLHKLKKDLHIFLDGHASLQECWITSSLSSNIRIASLSSFLKEEFFLSTTHLDLLQLLQCNLKDSFGKKCHKKTLLFIQAYHQKKKWQLLEVFTKIFHLHSFNEEAKDNSSSKSLSTKLDNSGRLNSGLMRMHYALSSKKLDQINCSLLKLLSKLFFTPNITSIKEFSTPSLKRSLERKHQLLLFYTIASLIILFSSSSLVYDYIENKKFSQQGSDNSISLQKSETELKELVKEAKALSDARDLEIELKNLQRESNKWPLILNQLDQDRPEGVWLTQLKVITQKEEKAPNKVIALEIKGLFLQGINGEVLVQRYVEKLSHSSLFITNAKKDSWFCCTKEDANAYTYPFSIKLQLVSPILL